MDFVGLFDCKFELDSLRIIPYHNKHKTVYFNEYTCVCECVLAPRDTMLEHVAIFSYKCITYCGFEVIDYLLQLWTLMQSGNCIGRIPHILHLHATCWQTLPFVEGWFYIFI